MSDETRDLVEMMRSEIKEFRALREVIARSWEGWEERNRERNRAYDEQTKRHRRSRQLAWLVNGWFVLVTVIVLNWISKHP